MSNLKQIGVAAAMYQQDYDGYYVPFSTYNNGPGPYSAGQAYGDALVWPNMLFPYINNAQVFICPSDSGYNGKRIYHFNNSPQPNYVVYGSYTMNTAKVNGFSCVYPNTTPYNKYTGFRADATFPGVRDSAVQNPSTKIFIVDGLQGSTSLTTEQEYIFYGLNSTYCTTGDTGNVSLADGGTNTSTNVSSRHSGGFNALFADDHVKWIKYGASTPDEWAIQAP